jgi:hypothetical protein
VVSVPAMSAGQGCSTWFDSQRVSKMTAIIDQQQIAPVRTHAAQRRPLQSMSGPASCTYCVVVVCHATC